MTDRLRISVNNGKYTMINDDILVDEEDREWLDQWEWHWDDVRGAYRLRQDHEPLYPTIYKLTQEILKRRGLMGYARQINENRLDCRRENIINIMPTVDIKRREKMLAYNRLYPKTKDRRHKEGKFHFDQD